MNAGRYRLRGLGLRSLASMGCLMGALLVLAPALVCGLLSRPLVAGAYRWLTGWQDVRLGLVRIDLVQALHLSGALGALEALDAAGWWLALAVAAAVALGAAVVWALVTVGAGLGYNLLARLAGGLEIELGPVASEESDGQRR